MDVADELGINLGWHTPPVHLRRTLALGLVAVALASTGCTEERRNPTDPVAQSPTPEEGPWPLTGLPGYPDASEAQIVTVKVDNTSSGQPQAGIGKADLVVQEMVEGGVTRLAVMYQSTYPKSVGPVRSMRTTDIGIVLPTGGTLAASGGEASTVAAVRAAGIPVVIEGDPGFSRATDRSAPYNLMLDLRALEATLPAGRPPGPYLPFGELPTDVSSKPAGSVTLSWPNATSRFTYDPGTELWTLDGPSDPSGYSFTNVVALMLPVEFAGGRDASGTPIPTMVTEGTGRAMVATGGRFIEVQWQKPSASAPWTFTYEPQGATPSADPTPVTLQIPAGRTWLGLLPVDGGSVSRTKPAPTPSASP